MSVWGEKMCKVRVRITQVIRRVEGCVRQIRRNVMQWEGDGMRTWRNWAEGRGEIWTSYDEREWEIGEEIAVERGRVHLEWEEVVVLPFSRAELCNESDGDRGSPFLEKSGCKMFQTVLKNITTTAIEKTTAVMHPITTRMIALICNDGRKAIIKPVHTSLTVAKNPARISAFFVS